MHKKYTKAQALHGQRSDHLNDLDWKIATATIFISPLLLTWGKLRMAERIQAVQVQTLARLRPP